jgi:hypothetical protein
VRHHDLAIIHPGILKSRVLEAIVQEAVLGIAADALGADIRIEDQGRVDVSECDDRLHAFLQNEIDQIVVVLQALLIDRRSWQSEWQNALPGYAERVVRHSHSSKALDILLVQIIIFDG